VPKQGEPQDQQAPEAEERTNFSARVRVSVRKRAKLYAAGHDVSLQDLVDAALDEYLRKRNA
jgi:predicted HicB family RNase H-like nuclease